MHERWSAARFRAELQRVDLTLTGFSAMTGIPFRTAQNYALGLRPVPKFMAFMFKGIRLYQRYGCP